MMVKLFRNIRKKLAAESNFASYSRYAIGEIVLVVFGILIALQINNWNEERKLQEFELKLVRQLLEDVKADAAFFSTRIDFQKKRDTLLGNLVQFGLNPALDSLGNQLVNETPFFFRLAYQSNLVHNNPNAYEVVSDDVMKGLLRLYHAKYDYVVHGIELQNRVVERIGMPLEIKYRENFRNLHDSTIYVKDYAMVLQDKEVIATLEQFDWLGVNYLYQVEAFLEVNKELEQHLITYLKDNK